MLGFFYFKLNQYTVINLKESRKSGISVTLMLVVIAMVDFNVPVKMVGTRGYSEGTECSHSMMVNVCFFLLFFNQSLSLTSTKQLFSSIPGHVL